LTAKSLRLLQTFSPSSPVAKRMLKVIALSGSPAKIGDAKAKKAQEISVKTSVRIVFPRKDESYRQGRK
jgi:hypothetical protein